MIGFLAQRGTQRMVGHVLRENVGMSDLAVAFGFSADAAAAGTDALRFVLALPGPGGKEAA